MKAILTWHSIDSSCSVISTSPGEMVRQLDALARAGVKVLPLDELLASDDDIDAVALTFDDGYSNFASHALPVLRSRGLPATVFVAAGKVGGSNDWDADHEGSGIPRLQLMSWDEIARAAEAGIEIGGHGLTHRRLSGVDREVLDDEIDGCAAVIAERIGRSPSSFAFPYGDCDRAAVGAVARGHAIACTTRFGTLTPGDDAHALPRLDMFYFRNPALLEKWGSPRFRAFVAVRGAARQVKAGLADRMGRGR